MNSQWAVRSYRRFTRVSVLVLVGCMALPAPAGEDDQGPKTYYLSHAEDGHVLAVLAGDTITLTLEHDDEHYWDLDMSTLNQDVLGQTEGTQGFSSYIDESGSLVLLFGNTWHFKAGSPGSTTIRARYIRYSDASVQDTFRVSVHVFAAGEDGEEPDPGDEPARPFALVLLLDEIGDAIPGQRCVFPVMVVDEGIGDGAGEPVALSTNLPGQTGDALVSVEPKTIRPGDVAELTIVPLEPGKIDPLTEGWQVYVPLAAERAGVRRRRAIEVTVHPGEDLLTEAAASCRDLFIPWLARNHPEFGVTLQTEWTGTIVRPHILAVSYYLFFSPEWEMGVRWHVASPPHDWAELYLRRRDDLSSTYAWRIHSVAGGLEPEVTELPPEGLFR